MDARGEPMIDFGLAAVFGLCIGFLWGIGCSLAILYSIYLGGYRKAVEESLEPASTSASGWRLKSSMRGGRNRPRRRQ